MIMGAMPRHPVSAVLTWRLDCLVADAAHRKLDPSTSTSGRERDFHPVASGRFETGAAPLDGGDSLPLHLRRRNDCQGAPLLLLATLILAACLEVPLLGVLRAGLPSGATRSHQEPSGAIRSHQEPSRLPSGAVCQPRQPRPASRFHTLFLRPFSVHTPLHFRRWPLAVCHTHLPRATPHLEDHRIGPYLHTRRLPLLGLEPPRCFRRRRFSRRPDWRQRARVPRPPGAPSFSAVTSPLALPRHEVGGFAPAQGAARGA